MSKNTHLVKADRSVANKIMTDVFTTDQLDSMIKSAMASGNGASGVEEMLNDLTKVVLERALQAEMAVHLGYESGDSEGRGSGNSRNGLSTKTVSTSNGPIEIDVPRDRNGSFEPVIVPKRARRIGNINATVLSLYSRGMTTRDIEAHFQEVYGTKLSRETISTITDVVIDEIKAWQSRPLDEVYPILYVDAIRLRVKDNGVVTTKSAYLAIGVDVEGRKHALGCWIQDTEGAKFWAKVLADLKNRGVKDILIVCCDGLTGLPDAIRSVFPETVVQTCVVHVVRNAMRFVSYGERKAVAKDMREIYTAPTLEAAELALKAFDTKYGEKYPGAVDVWQHAWPEFTPFLDYPAELRKIIYTTNQIESINFQLRKITKNRGHFDSNDAAMKLLYLGLRNISSERGGYSGTGTRNWTVALNTLFAHFPGRIPM